MMLIEVLPRCSRKREMDALVDALRALYDRFFTRLANLLSRLQGTPKVQLTGGLLGLALFLYVYYQGGGRPGGRPPQHAAGPPQQIARSSAVRKAGGSSSTPSGSASQVSKPKQSLGSAIRAQLSGVRNVTVSAPGVLLEEWLPTQLEEAATLKPGAAAVLREVLSVAKVTLLAHVAGDVGQAALQGALEAGGLVGSGKGQVPPHRVLFCSTLVGKVSIVRQLEPELHIDGHASTVADLQRFIPQLVLVQQDGAASKLSLSKATNISAVPSLESLFS